MLTIQEIRQLQTKDLQEELNKNTHELMRVKMDLMSGASKESHRLKLFKKQIARLKTVQKENHQATLLNNTAEKRGTTQQDYNMHSSKPLNSSKPLKSSKPLNSGKPLKSSKPLNSGKPLKNSKPLENNNTTQP